MSREQRQRALQQQRQHTGGPKSRPAYSYAIGRRPIGIRWGTSALEDADAT